MLTNLKNNGLCEILSEKIWRNGNYVVILRRISADARKKRKIMNTQITQNTGEMVVYQPNAELTLEVKVLHDSVWLNVMLRLWESTSTMLSVKKLR